VDIRRKWRGFSLVGLSAVLSVSFECKQRIGASRRSRCISRQPKFLKWLKSAFSSILLAFSVKEASFVLKGIFARGVVSLEK